MPAHANTHQGFAEPVALLSAIVDSADDAIVSKNLDGIITSWNKGAERMFGYAAEEVVGRPITILIPPDRLSEEPKILERLRRGERVEHFETIRMRKDGGLLDISLTISPVRDSAGKVIGASKIARDITERKRIEEELHQHRHHLQELVEQRTAELAATHARLRSSERLSSIGTLSAGLGHDIGNVMMPLKAQIQAIEAELGPSARALRDRFEVIAKGIAYLQSLAGGLRMLAIDPELQCDIGTGVDLLAWWQQTEPLLKTVLPRQCVLEHDIPADMPAVAVPDHMLTQAVFNLVQNAAQALAAVSDNPQRSHGRIRVAALLDVAEKMIRMSVSDNGPGMTEEVRQHCLEPFFTTKTRSISTGLGLAVVHGIVKNAKGTLEIESAPGAGAVFTMTLPVAPSTGASDTMPPRVARLDIADARIRALVTHELSSLNFALANGSADHTLQPHILVIDACEERRAIATDFLARNPHGHVVVVGCPASASTSERIIEIGPAIRRDALRQALRSVTPQASVSPA